MRIAVTGAKGQVAMSLMERTNRDIEIVPLSRPTFALEDRQAVLAGIKAAGLTSSSTPPPIRRWIRPRQKKNWRSG